jgi:hypothetical protein
MIIQIQTMSGKWYNVFYTVLDSTRPAPLERVFKSVFVKDMMFFEEDIETTIDTMNRRGLNITIIKIEKV